MRVGRSAAGALLLHCLLHCVLHCMHVDKTDPLPPAPSTGAVCQRCGGQQQTVVFRHVTYEVRAGRGKGRRWQPLLHDVSGYVAPQELTALMGPSGSG